MVDPSVAGQQRIVDLGQRAETQRVVGCPLQERVGDVVLHALGHAEEAQIAVARPAPVEPQECVRAVVFLVGRDEFFAQEAGDDL